MAFRELLHEVFSTVPSPLHLNYALLGGFIAFFGLISLFVKERLYLTESLVSTLIGVLFGPSGLKIVQPHLWFKSDFFFVLKEVARIVIALQVMVGGVSAPVGYLRKNLRSVAIFLGPVMLVMWGVSAACIKVTLGLDWLQSLIIAACVTPTDPVLASSVIKGKFAERYIPTRLRNLLSVESAANDGLGLPFMMLPIWLLLSKTKGEAIQHWLIHTWLWEIIGSIVLGVILGLGARFLLKASLTRKLIDKESILSFTIALTLFVTGIVTLFNSDDLFAVFVSGTVLAWDEKLLKDTEDYHINEVIDLLFNITFFVFFGSIIPWRRYLELSISKLLLASILILLLRRLPVVMMLRKFTPSLQGKKEAFFAGWFGPIGVGAIFFAIHARDIFLHHSHDSAIPMEFIDSIFPIVSFIVLSSILIHGITVPLTNSQLKRRMKRKIKRRNKLAARLVEIAEHSRDTSPHDSSHPTIHGNSHPLMGERHITDHSSLRSPQDYDVEDEYVYVTDDEGENHDRINSPNDVIIHSADDDHPNYQDTMRSEMTYVTANSHHNER